MTTKDIQTKDQARTYAIEWSNTVSKKSLSYAELTVYQEFFNKLAKKFNLTDEFKENGII